MSLADKTGSTPAIHGGRPYWAAVNRITNTLMFARQYWNEWGSRGMLTHQLKSSPKIGGEMSGLGERYRFADANQYNNL